MLSIYKKEFGESNENAETSASGSPDTLIPAGTSFVTAFIPCVSFPPVLESTFHILKHSSTSISMRQNVEIIPTNDTKGKGLSEAGH